MMNEPDLKEVFQNLINGFVNDIAHTRIMGCPRRVEITFPGTRYLKEAFELCYRRGVMDTKRNKEQVS
jgi:hypothetical protein